MSRSEVSVTVRLKDKFSKTLNKLNEQLNYIDQKRIRPEFDIGDGGQINRLNQKLDGVDKSVTTRFNLTGLNNLTRAKIQAKSLSGVQNLYVKVHDNELTSAVMKKKALMQRNRDFVWDSSDFVGGHKGTNYEDLARRFSGEDGGGGGGSRSRKRHEHTDNRKSLLGSLRQKVGGLLSGSDDDGGGSGSGRRAGRGIRGIPSGAMAQQMASFMMPFMFTAIVGGLGAIAAATGPAIAGITALGAGFLGFGENAADSMHLAKVRMRMLGREMHKVFKPTMKTFAPWVDKWIKQAPHKLAGALQDPAMDMERWMPTVEGIGSGMLDWTVEFLNTMNRLQPVIDSIIGKLGRDIGGKLIGFFEWVIYELDQNYGQIKRTLAAFGSVARLIYRMSVLWTQAIANLSGIINLITRLIGVLGNNAIAGPIIAATLSAYIFLGVLSKVWAMLVGIKTYMLSSWVAGMVKGLAAAITGVMGLNAALAKTIALIAATGIGAILVGGGILASGFLSDRMPSTGGVPDDFGGSGGGPGMGGGGNTINVYGNPDTSTMQQFRDEFPGEYRTQRGVENNMEQ